ncbi:MAG: ThuA domain-containing protein, partial [Thermoguttaceae bacterium]|nr:ThuA domain-containing protein [Thermoguttaceae bacterium]
ASKASLLPKPSDAFLSLLQKAEQINDQKAIIAAMGEKCYLPDVIELATKIMKESEALRATAGLALVRMANTIRRTDPNAAKAILTTVMDQVENKDIAKRAATVLATIGRNEDCIRDWLYAGPFVLDGKSGEETFRHIFPAEADRPEVQWQHLMGGWQGGNRWNLDVGIEPVPNSVACLKTYIWSDMDQQLVFQAACSGGIAAWCDKQPILNQWRNEPFEQWTFSAPIALKKGYNSLVIKTSCADKGWFFSARLRTPDDQSPKNIRVESRRRNPPQKVLLFTGSQTWIHSPTVSGPHGNCCAELVLKSVCRDLGLELVWTDSGDVFNYPLDDYAAFVFYTCGELDKPGRNGMTPVTDAGLKAFFIAIREKGKGFFVIHSGSDTLHKHPEYIKMVGAEFVNHGMQQEAGVEIIGNALPQTEKILGKKFRHFEEWYAFRNFNPDMRVLMMQDTSDMLTEGRNAYYKQPSYPCTWIRGEGKGIVAFTSLGHSCEFWRSKEYRSLLTELLSIVTRLQAVDMTPNYNSVVNTKQ